MLVLDCEDTRFSVSDLSNLLRVQRSPQIAFQKQDFALSPPHIRLNLRLLHCLPRHMGHLKLGSTQSDNRHTFNCRFEPTLFSHYYINLTPRIEFSFGTRNYFIKNPQVPSLSLCGSTCVKGLVGPVFRT